MKYLECLRTKSTRLEVSILLHLLFLPSFFCFSLTSLWPSISTFKKRTFTSITLIAVRTFKRLPCIIYILKIPKFKQVDPQADNLTNNQ